MQYMQGHDATARVIVHSIKQFDGYSQQWGQA